MAATTPSSKPRLGLVVIGHVDAGKSTTTGHLLVKCGGVDERTIARFEADGADSGYAWVLDTLKAERERNITIQCTTRQFDSGSYSVQIVDAPGHRDFIKSMISGTSAADAALVVIDSRPNGFEAGWSEDGQTREHMLLASTLGIKHVVCAINKMDDDAVAYSEARFDEICETVAHYAKKVGFKNAVTFVPISGMAGDNIVEPSENTPWYSGPTLVAAIDSIPEPTRAVDAPLRMPVSDVYKISGVGTVVSGRIESGSLAPGTRVAFGPTGLTADARSVQAHHKAIDLATPGDSVGVNVPGVSVKDVRRGDIMGSAAAPPRAAESFVAQLVVLAHPGEIRVGYTPVLACGTTHVACRVDELISKIDKRSGKVTDESPESLKAGDAAMVRFVPTKAMVVEPFASMPCLGRFAVRDMRRTVGIGIVKEVAYAD